MSPALLKKKYVSLHRVKEMEYRSYNEARGSPEEDWCNRMWWKEVKDIYKSL